MRTIPITERLIEVNPRVSTDYTVQLHSQEEIERVIDVNPRVFTDYAVQLHNQGDIVKGIEDVIKGDKDEAKQIRVLQYFKDNWNSINKKFKYSLKEELITNKNRSEVLPKTLIMQYSPVLLAVIFKCDFILSEVYTHMIEDAEFAREVLLDLKVDTNLEKENLDKYEDIPDEACGLSAPFLCVKYNPEALGEILEIAQIQNLLNGVMSYKEMRGMNLLHFSTKNITLECIK